MSIIDPPAQIDKAADADKRNRPPECTRDRLLRVLNVGPRLTDEEASLITDLVRETREASIGE